MTCNGERYKLSDLTVCSKLLRHLSRGKTGLRRHELPRRKLKIFREVSLNRRLQRGASAGSDDGETVMKPDLGWTHSVSIWEIRDTMPTAEHLPP